MTTVKLTLVNIPESFGPCLASDAPDCVHIPEQFTWQKRSIDQLVQINIPITVNVTAGSILLIAAWLYGRYQRLSQSKIVLTYNIKLEINGHDTLIDESAIAKRLESALNQADDHDDTHPVTTKEIPHIAPRMK